MVGGRYSKETAVMAEDTTTPETGEQEKETEATETVKETPAAKADDLPDAVKDILKKERKAAADAEKARKAAEAKVKEYEDRDKSESEKLAEQLADAEKARDEALSTLTRFEVAAEKKLPAELASLLSGSKEEMESKADLLLQHAQAAPPPDFSGGPRKPAAKAKSPTEAHDDFVMGLFGRPEEE